MQIQRTEAFNDIERIYTTETLDNDTLAETSRIFAQYHLKGVIKNENIEDMEWILYDEKSTVKLSYDVDVNKYESGAGKWTGCSLKTFILALKAFVLLCMGTYVLNTIQNIVRSCKAIASSSAEIVLSWKEIPERLFAFLTFLPGSSPTKDAILENLEIRASEWRNNRRNLSPFSVYICFEEALSSLWKQLELAEQIRIFPVYLWWCLTVILPLRPTEFLLLPKNCLSSAEEGFRLTVRRTRLKKGKRIVSYRIEEDYECFTYCIPDSLAEKIQWYKSAVAGMRQSELDTLFIPGKKSWYLNYSAMNRLLKSVLVALDMDPDAIHLGDTRHLSMISLILTGDTPSVCKALANHESIETSSGYYTNMWTLNDCQVLHFLHDSVCAATLFSPRTTHLAATPDMLRMGQGSCAYYTADEFDGVECMKTWQQTLGSGACEACPHFIPDDDAILLNMMSNCRQDLYTNWMILMECIEQLRKGCGKVETIDMLLKRLRNTAFLYINGIERSNTNVLS